MPASTVAEYLASLPADRRAALTAVRKAINKRLPKGYEEGIQFGMGQGCVRFKTLDDLPLDVVGRTVARVTPAEHAANYQAMRDAMGKGKAKKPATKKAKAGK